jgi:hypothetical protein
MKHLFGTAAALLLAAFFNALVDARQRLDHADRRR